MTKRDEKPKVGEGMVLTVPNRHYECCGKPPDLNAKDGYTAYFENDYGEQIVFQYDFKTKKGTLWHGDCGWAEPISIMGGGTTIILSEEEREWLRLVWRVATRGETKEFQLRSSLDLVNAHKVNYDELLTQPEFASKDMQLTLLKAKSKLEKQGQALADELVRVQTEDAIGKSDQKEA